MSQVESFTVPLPNIHVRQVVSSVLLPAATLLFRLLLGGIFLWSSLSNLQQPYDFLSAVYNYELLVPQIGLLVAAVVPWLELATGVCLLLGIWERGAWLLAIILLSVFTVALYSVANRGLLIPCGCSRTPIEIVSYRNVLNTGLFLLAAVIGFGCSLAASFVRNNFPDLPSSPLSSSS